MLSVAIRHPHMSGKSVLAAFALFILATAAAGQQIADADAKILKAAGVATDAKGLVKYFDSYAPVRKKGDAAIIQSLIRQLKNGSNYERKMAYRYLVEQGATAVPYLMNASGDSALPAKTRGEINDCIKQIEARSGLHVESAAIRALAQLRPPRAAAVLMDFLPRVPNSWLEDEILRNLEEMYIVKGRVDDSLPAFLKDDSAARRGAAAYLLARHGALAQRRQVRLLLDDDDAEVRRLAQRGLLGKGLLEQQREMAKSDVALLKSHQIDQSENGLNQYLRKLSLDAQDQQKIKRLLGRLGDSNYRRRATATAELIRIGPPALPFLKMALTHADLEVVLRAEQSIDRIKRGPGPALPAAAVRRLAETTPATAIKTLLAYLPFAEDGNVEKQVLQSLCLLSTRHANFDEQIIAALTNAAPQRRGGAAFVLGKVGTMAHCSQLAGLLKDEDVHVRFRAAEGMLAAKDARAVPALIALLNDMPQREIWKAEEILLQIAGNSGPPSAGIKGGKDARQKMVQAWSRWWQTDGHKSGLQNLHPESVYLGRILICEYDRNLGRFEGRVWECDRSGRLIWEIKGLKGPMDAQVLPNGRVLVAENVTRRIIEIDKTGKVHWEHSTNTNPIACQRLRNGNTFIATYNELMEISPAGRVVYSINRGPAFYIFSARKLRDGKILCMTAQGQVSEIDADTQKEIKSINLGSNGWCGVDKLANGRYLIAQMGSSLVREIDAQQQTVWKCSFSGVFRAVRLPNGNTLAASMSQQKIAEFDRNGNLMREIACQGRPWQVRYR